MYREIQERMIAKMLMMFSQGDEISLFFPPILCFSISLINQKELLFYLIRGENIKKLLCEKATAKLLILLMTFLLEHSLLFSNVL